MTAACRLYTIVDTIEVRQTALFAKWLKDLRDLRARAQIIRRIDRAAEGNLGEIRPIGGGLTEMKIAYGPGYRVYFVQRGDTLIILLCGGDKSSQDRDIRVARTMMEELE